MITRWSGTGWSAFSFAPDAGFEVLGEAADGAEAVRLALALKPSVILMDLRMPGMDGVAAITELARRGVAARVLVLTTYDTDSHVLPAIEAGATGYLLKDAPRDELLRAVRAAAQGQAALSPSVATRLMSRVRAPGAERQPARTRVLALVASAHPRTEAAARLPISEATVKTCTSTPLGVGDRAAAVAGRPGTAHGSAGMYRVTLQARQEAGPPVQLRHGGTQRVLMPGGPSSGQLARQPWSASRGPAARSPIQQAGSVRPARSSRAARLDCTTPPEQPLTALQLPGEADGDAQLDRQVGTVRPHLSPCRTGCCRTRPGRMEPRGRAGRGGGRVADAGDE
jgi:DNA-binding NarL/FixJ family response regulator